MHSKEKVMCCRVQKVVARAEVAGLGMRAEVAGLEMRAEVACL